MKRKKAVSLIEVLIAITVIGIFIGLLLPAIQAINEAAKKNSQRQIAAKQINTVTGVLDLRKSGITYKDDQLFYHVHLTNGVKLVLFCEPKQAEIILSGFMIHPKEVTITWDGLNRLISIKGVEMGEGEEGK